MSGASSARASNDGQSSLELDIGKALRAAGLESGRPRSVAVAVPIEDPYAAGAWQTGLVAAPDTMLPGSLAVAPEKSVKGFAPLESLQLRPANTKDKGLTAEACAGGKCRPLAVETVALNRYRVDVQGSSFMIDVHGDLCRAGASGCEISVPSWSLAQRGTRGDGSAPFFPRVLAAVQLDGEVALLDAEQGSVVLDLMLPGKDIAQDLGRLVAAQFYRQGALVLRFAQGAMLLDFAQDMLLFVNGGGAIWLMDRGLGALAHGETGTFLPLADAGASPKSLATPLLLTADTLVTDQGLMRFELDAHRGFVKRSYAEGDGSWKEAHGLIGDTHAIAVLSVGADGVASVLGAKGDDARPLSLKSGTALKSDLHDTGEFRLSQKTIYVRRGDGWHLPESQDQIGASIIPGTRRREMLLGATGTVFAQRTVTGGADCDWTRHRLADRASQAAATYIEDGSFRTACDTPVEFNQANAAGVEAAVVWEKGATVRIHLFLPAG